jgi:hypothetical protein
MATKLLICDNTAALGRVIARKFMNMGIPSDCCRDSLSVMENCLQSGGYKGIVLFALRPDERLLSFIASAASRGISVFAGLYTSLGSIRRAFLQAGAVQCVTMPCSVNTLCNRVMLRLDYPAELLPRIELFLEETGFPRRLSGFCCLAKACELCIRAPERLWGGMSGIYAETAECFSNTSSSVERSLRLLGEAAGKNGTLSCLTDCQITQKPTNTELICAVCDAFFRKPYK